MKSNSPTGSLALWLTSLLRAFAVCLLGAFILLPSPLSIRGHAASITHTFLNPDGTGFTNTVLFRPKLDRAVLVSPSITPYVDTRVSPATNGGIAATLRAGDYSVFVGASRPFSIAVPDSTNSYDLAALITGTNVLSTGPFTTVTTVGDATSTGGGKVKTDTTVADPVVYLSSTVDDLLATAADAAAADVGALGSELNAALEEAVADLDAVDTGLAEDLAAQAASFAAATALKLDASGGVATSLTTATVAGASNDVVSLRAAWKLNGDVRYWGAKLNGTDNDRDAFAAAALAVTNIYIDSGIALINGDTIPIVDNFRIRTRGPGSATIKRTTTGSAAFTAAENRAATNVVIEGVYFVGGGWNTGDITCSAITLKTNSTFGAIIRDCTFDRFVGGVRSQRGNTNLSVIGCRGIALADTLVLAYAPVGGRFIANTLDGDRTGIGDGLRTKVGIWLHDPGDGAGPGWGNFVNANRISGTRNEGIIVNQALSVVDANIVSDATDGASGTSGIVVETTGATGTGLIGLGAGNWVTVTGNQVYACDGGIRVSVDPINLTLATPQNVVVRGNMIEGCFGTHTKGISVGFSASGADTAYYTSRATVTDNWIHNASAAGNADGIYLFNVQAGAVTGNHIFNAKRYGVILDTIAAGATNQITGVAITGNDIHDPSSAGVYLFPRVPGAIVRCSVLANSIMFTGTQTGNGVEVDSGVTNGIVECSFIGNSVNGNASYNGYGLLLNGSNLLAAGNVGNAVYGRSIQKNGPTTWISNGNINDVNGRKIFFDSAAPASTSQQHNAGDICWNTSLSSGGPVGWICITAGTAGSSAGVWKDFGIAGIQSALDAKFAKTGGLVSGDLTVSQAFIVTNTAALLNNTTVGGTFGVTGVANFTNDVQLQNAKKIRGYSSAGSLRDLVYIDANNYVQIGDSSASRLILNPPNGGFYLGTVSAGSDIYIPRVGVASGGNTLRNSRSIDLISSYWTGSAEVQLDNTILAVAVNTSGKTGIQLTANGTIAGTFYSDGIVSLPGATTVGSMTVNSNGIPIARIRHGSATLVGGTVTVSDAFVTANTKIFPTHTPSTGGTIGWLRTSARSAGTSFTVTSSSATDTSVIDWLAIEP